MTLRSWKLRARMSCISISKGVRLNSVGSGLKGCSCTFFSFTPCLSSFISCTHSRAWDANDRSDASAQQHCLLGWNTQFSCAPPRHTLHSSLSSHPVSVLQGVQLRCRPVFHSFLCGDPLQHLGIKRKSHMLVFLPEQLQLVKPVTSLLGALMENVSSCLCGTELRSVFLMDVDCKSNFNIYFLFKVTLSDLWFCLMAAWDVGSSCGARSNSQWKQKQTDDQTAAVCLSAAAFDCLRITSSKNQEHPSLCGQIVNSRRSAFSLWRMFTTESCV